MGYHICAMGSAATVCHQCVCGLDIYISHLCCGISSNSLSPVCVDWTAIYHICALGSAATACHQCVWTGQLYIIFVLWDQQQQHVTSVCGLDSYISYLCCGISSNSLSPVCVDWTFIYHICAVGSAATACHQCVWTGQLYIIFVLWDQQQQLVTSVCGLDSYISYLCCGISMISLSPVCVDWTAIYHICAVGSAVAACHQCVWTGQLYIIFVLLDQQQQLVTSVCG